MGHPKIDADMLMLRLPILLFFCVCLWMPVAWAGESLAGKLLVARTSLDGTSFARTVILLFEHDGEGAFGLTVNRPVGKIGIADFLEGIGRGAEGVTGEMPLFSGGPVQQNIPFLMHSADYGSDATSHRAGGAAITLNEQILKDIAAGAGPVYSRLVLGYAGWAGGQLESEIERGSWDIIDSDAELVFTTPPQELWQTASDKVGIEL